MTTLRQAQAQIDRLKQRRNEPPSVTTLEIIDPATGEPCETYEVIPGQGWTLTFNPRDTSEKTPELN